MSNYQKENLLTIAPEKVPAGTLAVKVGDDIFTAGNIKVTGTDVSATTATALDVLEGKQFYDAQGVLTQGTLVPQTGGAMDFYKCAAVAGEPLSEPVFHAPLSADSSSAETGQTLSKYGSVSFTEVDGVPCAHFQSGGIYSTSGLDISNGLTVATKVRLTSVDYNTYLYFGDAEMNSLGLWSTGGSFEFGSLGKASGGTIFTFSHNIQTDIWYDFVVVYNGSKLAFYIDGALVYSGAWSYDVSTAFIGIGCYKAGNTMYSQSTNYQADFKVFNQALSAEQVAELYNKKDSGSSTDLVVSGFSDERFNGTYTLEDPNAEGRERVWVKDDISFQAADDEYSWYILTDEWNGIANPPYAYGRINELDIDTKEDAPWNVSGWSLYTNYHGGTGTPVVTLASGGSDSGSTLKIKISGATFDTSVNGDYSYFSDSVKSWVNVWRTTDERAQIHTFENDSYWYLAVDDGDGGYTPRYIGTVNSIGQQPWEVTSWQTISGSIESGLTVEKVGGSSGNEIPDETPSEPEAPLAPNTWNGYKAVLVTDTDGKKYYEFEETLTTGLTYGKGFTPVVDKVYDSQAMIMATLTTAVVIPLPVWENALNSKSGFSVTGTVTEGDNCLTFADGGALATSITKFPQGNKPFSFAISFKNAVDKDQDYNMIFSIGARPTSNYVFVLGFSRGNGGKLTVSTWGDMSIESSKVLTGIADWQRVMIVNEGNGKAHMYINGELEATGSGEFNISDVTCEFGGAFWDYNHFEGSLADCKVWDVALSAEQVVSDYQNFSI